MQETDYQSLIDLALAEDLGETGDVTSAALFTDEGLETRLISKDTGVLAGSELFIAVFTTIDPQTAVTFHRDEGARLEPGAHVADLHGKATSILSGERVSLNFLGFLSGIATAAAEYADEAAKGGHAVILDTRKTLPGFRTLSKYATAVGGAKNHRMGLHDMVLLKDNHIDRAGSIATAVERARAKWGATYRIEVECRTLEEVREAKEQGVDMIMLDNMSTDAMREAVQLCAGEPMLEASGNMRLERIREVAATGVDAISVGGLTHSVRSFDFSLQTRKVR